MAEPDDKKIDLLILGVHLKSESYPNVLFRIQDLLNHSGLEIQEINFPMWTASTQPQQGRKRLFRNPFRVVKSHLTVLFRYLRSGYRSSVYIPYPAILLQFLMEAIVLCNLGGILGVLVGFGLGNLVAVFTDFAVNVPVDWAVRGVLFCSAVGLIFGMWPAIRASRLAPIDALSYE